MRGGGGIGINRERQRFEGGFLSSLMILCTLNGLLSWLIEEGGEGEGKMMTFNDIE